MDGSDSPAPRPGSAPPEESAEQSLIMRARPMADGARLLQLIGVLDQRTAPLLERRLVEETRRCTRTPPRLLLDLGRVTFLDRAGLDILLDAQTRLSNGYGTVELANPTPRVVRLLHEAHLDGASGAPPAATQTGSDGEPQPG